MKHEIEKKETMPTVSISQMTEFQPIDEGDTVTLPRLSLIQGKRQEIKDGIAKEGDLINSLSKENYGPSVEIVPIVQRKSTRIRWKDRDLGGGMLCVARDGKNGTGDPGGQCQSCVFRDDHYSKTGCTINYEIIAIVRGSKEPIILAADSIKPADRGVRDLLGMARMNANKGLRMFQKSYILKSVEAKNKQYEFFKLSCLPGNDNKPLPEDEAKFMEMQAQYFLGAKIDVEIEGESPAAESDGWK
jgi:hypothetical protein